MALIVEVVSEESVGASRKGSMELAPSSCPEKVEAGASLRAYGARSLNLVEGT